MRRERIYDRSSMGGTLAAENLCKILEEIGNKETSHLAARFYDNWCQKMNQALMIGDHKFSEFVLRLVKAEAMRSLKEDNYFETRVKTHLSSMITTRYRQHLKSYRP